MKISTSTDHLPLLIAQEVNEMHQPCCVPRVSAIPIERIRPHEEFDIKILNGVMTSLQSEGVVRDPVLIDSNSHMILDGTHRYWALIELGCRSIPVAVYSYMSDSVKIGCWYRCLELCDLEISSRTVASKTKIDTAENALNAVSGRRAQVSVICKDSARIFVSDRFNIFEAYSLLSTLEKDYKKRAIMLHIQRSQTQLSC